MKINSHLNLSILFFAWLSRSHLIKLSFWYNLESKHKCNPIGFSILMHGEEASGGCFPYSPQMNSEDTSQCRYNETGIPVMLQSWDNFKIFFLKIALVLELISMKARCVFNYVWTNSRPQPLLLFGRPSLSSDRKK